MSLQKDRLDLLLSEAKKLEKKYEWLQAAVKYGKSIKRAHSAR
jgi:hypothetical protein